MTRQYRAEFISIGTELLLGQIVNSNARWLSDQFTAYGVNVLYHSVVGDNLKRLEETFEIASKRANLIIITGGLGPTDDDLTREAFSAFSKLSLSPNEQVLQKLDNYFKQQNLEMTENNKKQALVFETADVLNNTAGMAPGMILRHKGITWIFLPGVPREMKTIVNEHILPYIRAEIGEQVIRSKVLRFIGISESALENQLHDLLRQQTNPSMALLATATGLTLRLTAKADSESLAKGLLAEAKLEVLSVVGSYCYGEGHESIFEHVFHLLKEHKLKIGAAESLTGGKFADRLIEIPGSSEVLLGSVVCYDSTIKQSIVGVRKETIERAGTVSQECATELAINIRNLMNADIGISFTGVAGPDSVEGKKVGTVWIGIVKDDDQVIAEEFHFTGTRETIRNQAVLKGYELLFKTLS